MAYVVFAVENADRLVLMGPPVAGQPTFKSVALSFIQAPKQAKRTVTGEFGPEEPCAYDAAELIRSTFIGKPVKFTEDYFIEPLNRSAGQLTLVGGENAAVLLLKNGLATVPDHIPSRMDKALFAHYTQLMKDAKAAGKGIFSPQAEQHVRHMVNLPAEELAKRVEELKGKEILSRVERVLSSVVLIISNKQLGETQTPVHLTGITAKDAECEALSAQTRFFTERFLLHRNVNLRFDGIDSFGNVLVSVMSKKGSFQEELLSKGLVKILPSTLSFSSRLAEMQEAEQKAQQGRHGVWKNFDPEAQKKVVQVSTNPGASAEPAVACVNTDGTAGPVYEGPQLFNGTLIQVVHGDTIVVREEGTTRSIRLALAGVRSSKNIIRDQDGNSPETRVTYNDYAWEAREFLRRHFIGARVTVQVEFARLMPETKEVRPAATVTVPATGANIGAALLEAGYATFFLGKTDSTSSAASLQAAQERAKAARAGMYSDKSEAGIKVVELNHLGEARGRYYLSFLQRGMQGKRPPVLRGVVDMVVGPSSLRVYIPKEHFQIPVKLSGVITPFGATNTNGKPDPFAEESRDFAVSLLQQREVNIQVYTSDRTGNFISGVFLQNGVNASVALVEAGLATVGNAEQLPFAHQLHDAEEAAKKKKLGVWSAEGALPQRAAKLEVERAALNPHMVARVVDKTAELTPYVLAEAGDNGLSVYLQSLDPALREKKQQMQPLLNQTASSPQYHPKRNEVVIAQYKQDKTWCRAKVLHANSVEETVEVQFLDYGNRDEVSIKRVRAIPRGPEYALVRDTLPLARLCYLAFIKQKVPSDAYVNAACDTIYEYTDGNVLAKAVYRDAAGRVFWTVTTDEQAVSLNEILLQHGYGTLDKRASAADPEAYKRHAAAQESARRSHEGLWEYGDVDDDEDED